MDAIKINKMGRSDHRRAGVAVMSFIVADADEEMTQRKILWHNQGRWTPVNCK